MGNRRIWFLLRTPFLVRVTVYLFVLLPVLSCPMALSYAAGIAHTKHNLSISGPGEVKSASEERICVFCHTPHNKMADVAGVNIPLWNHTMSRATYQVYGSSSMLSRSIQPDGSSKACLSCHDGTVAIGSLVNTGASQSSVTMLGAGAGGVMPSGSTNLGTNLSGHHPISIEMNSSLTHDKENQAKENIVSFKICRPLGSSPVKLYKTSNTYGGTPTGLGLQCSSCHDAHNDPDPGHSVFLRIGNKTNFDDLCLACHRYSDDACQ